MLAYIYQHHGSYGNLWSFNQENHCKPMGFGPRYPISESVLNQRAVATRKWHISSDKTGIYHLPEIPEVFSEE